MSTEFNQNQPTDIASKYKQSLQKSVDNSYAEILNYVFKPRDKTFVDTFSKQTYDTLPGFTILSVLSRFFYTEDATGITYISNILTDKDEKIMFSFRKQSYKILGKLEHDFAALDKLCFEQKELNRKIILVGIYEGKLMKIEAPVTSERGILRYLQESNNQNTADMSSTEKTYKEGMTTAIIALEKSKDQTYVDQASETKYFQTLDSNIKNLNKSLFSGDTTPSDNSFMESPAPEFIDSHGMDQHSEMLYAQSPVPPEQTSLSDLVPDFDFTVDSPHSL